MFSFRCCHKNERMKFMKRSKIKLLSSVFAVIFSASVFINSDYAAAYLKKLSEPVQYKSRLQSISDSLLNKSETEEWQDVNNDGIINSFDA